MAHSLLRAVTRASRTTTLRTFATSTARSSEGTYPDARYSQVMPKDVDFHYPKLGNRDIVGFGMDATPCYYDELHIPFPPVRFKENTPDILALRKKAEGDWKNLTIDEMKSLYRSDFAQTFAEVNAPSGDWRIVWAGVFFAITFAGWIIIFINKMVYPPRPHTITKEWQEAQVERLIKMRKGHISGVASMWDYEKGQWK